MAKKQKVFIEYINRNKYYSSDPKIIEMKRLYDKWSDMKGLPILLFLAAIVIAIIPSCFIENQIYTIWTWLLFGLAVAVFIASITLGMLIAHFEEKYEKYEDIFMKTDEFKRQLAKYKKIEKQKHEKYLRDKSTDLVESYQILDDQHMPKETKIELLMEYIDRGEKRNDTNL